MIWVLGLSLVFNVVLILALYFMSDEVQKLSEHIKKLHDDRFTRR